MATQSKPRTKTTSSAKPKSPRSTTKIDLDSLSLSEIKDLHNELCAKLSNTLSFVGKQDIVLHYHITAFLGDEQIAENIGMTPLKAILHPTALAMAASRLRTALNDEVVGPVVSQVYPHIDVQPVNAIHDQPLSLPEGIM